MDHAFHLFLTVSRCLFTTINQEITMRLTPTEPNTEDGFTDENDIFGYREFGECLANLISNVDEPLVIVLDAPWGSGKSVFIRQWAGMIRERGGSVAYFDAFRNDIHDDAFLSLASKIHSLAKEKLDEDKSEEFLDIAGRVGKALAPVGFRIATRFVTLGLLNSEDIKAGSKAFENVVKVLRNEEEQDISEKLRKVDEERDLLESFRCALESVSNAITEENQKSEQHLPLIFIVDELDRCRPPFALDTIERVKHLFSVPNICFILITHLSEFEKTIGSAYGTGFDARKYLEKFYHLRIKLPEPSDVQQGQRNKYLNYLWKSLNLKFKDDSTDRIVCEEMQRLANVHTLSLRQIEHALTNVILVAASVNKNRMCAPLVLAGLCIMRQINPDLYEKARNNSLKWDEVNNFLMINNDRNDRNVRLREERVVNWWRYFVDPGAPEKIISSCSRALQDHFTAHDRLSLPHIFTNYIDNLANDYSRK